MSAHDMYYKDGGEELRQQYDLNSKSIVLDVGGYQGNWSKKIFDKYKCSIYIYEPIESFYKEIQTMFANNNKINIYNFGLLDEDCALPIWVNSDASSIYISADTRIENVQMRDICGVLLEENIKNIDLIKINIEGGEYALLHRIIDTNIINNINNIQIQFHIINDKSIDERIEIQKKLSNTHDLIYNYDFIWESWRKK